MKKLFNLSLMAGLLAVCSTFTACSSSNDDGGGTTVGGKRLVQWTETSGSYTDNYFVEYNSKGQIVQVKRVPSSGSTYTINYAYEDDKITKSENGYTTIYTLSNGRIVSSVSYSGSSSSSSTTTNYKYDDDGQLESESSSSSNDRSTTKYEWSNGNMAKETVTSTHYNYSTTSTYTYSYSDYSNSMLPRFSSIEDWVLESQGFFGKRNRNFPSKCTSSLQSNDVITTTSFDYTVEGGVVTKVIVTSTNSSGSVNNFTINCIWAEAK